MYFGIPILLFCYLKKLLHKSALFQDLKSVTFLGKHNQLLRFIIIVAAFCK